MAELGLSSVIPEPGVFLFYHKAPGAPPGRSGASASVMFPETGFGLGTTERAARRPRKVRSQEEQASWATEARGLNNFLPALSGSEDAEGQGVGGKSTSLEAGLGSEPAHWLWVCGQAALSGSCPVG